MSRIRTTLDTVTKAVSGTVNTELLSKITRLRLSDDGTCKAGEIKVESEPATLMTMDVNKQLDAKTDENTLEVKDKDGPKAEVKALQRFQPSAFTTNMDETYNHLAAHVNEYFGSDIQRQINEVTITSSNTSGIKDHQPMLASGMQKVDLDRLTEQTTSKTVCSEPESDVTPTVERKSISHYLSYKSPSVQAFVGSYITPLVPKFKSVAAEKDKTSEVGQARPENAGPAESTEQKLMEEKAKKLRSQKEKVLLSYFRLNISKMYCV